MEQHILAQLTLLFQKPRPGVANRVNDPFVPQSWLDSLIYLARPKLQIRLARLPCNPHPRLKPIDRTIRNREWSLGFKVAISPFAYAKILDRIGPHRPAHQYDLLHSPEE